MHAPADAVAGAVLAAVVLIVVLLTGLLGFAVEDARHEDVDDSSRPGSDHLCGR